LDVTHIHTYMKTIEAPPTMILNLGPDFQPPAAASGSVGVAEGRNQRNIGGTMVHLFCSFCSPVLFSVLFVYFSRIRLIEYDHWEQFESIQRLPQILPQ
jgi:hypothetical protein